MQRDLKVPYAFDAAGQVVAPLTATKKAAFTCLECAQRLDLKRSRRERPHFAHRPDALKVCYGESTLHLAAKHVLKAQLEQELTEHNRFVWHLPCVGVGERGCRDHAVLPQYADLSGWDGVNLEVVHQSYRFDVAVLRRGRVAYGFEVFFRHEVPEAKAQALSVPWLELYAEDILGYRPRIPHKHRQAELRCMNCTYLTEQLRKRATAEQQRSQVDGAFTAEKTMVERAWRAVLERAKTPGQIQMRGER